jgi:hypothetical protein
MHSIVTHLLEDGDARLDDHKGLVTNIIYVYPIESGRLSSELAMHYQTKRKVHSELDKPKETPHITVM